MGQPSRLDELRRRVRQDPASIAFAALAEEYRRQGLLGDAIDLCRAGLARHPTYILGRVTLARALFDSGDTDAAILEFEHVLRIAPDNLAALRGLAEAHAERGETGAALDRLRAAAAFAPQDAALRARMEELEAALGPTPADGRGGGEPASGPTRDGGVDPGQHAEPAVPQPESAGEHRSNPDGAVEPFRPPPAPASLDSDDAQREPDEGPVAPQAEADAGGALGSRQPDEAQVRPDAAITDGVEAARETPQGSTGVAWSEPPRKVDPDVASAAGIEPAVDTTGPGTEATVTPAPADASDATAADLDPPDEAVSVDLPAPAPPTAGLSERAFGAAGGSDDVSDSRVPAPAPSAWDLAFPQHGSAAGPFFDPTEPGDLALVGAAWDLGLPDAPPDPGPLAGESPPLSPVPAPVERVADRLCAPPASGNGDGPTPIAAPHIDGIPSERRRAALRTLERWLEALERARSNRSNLS